MVKLIKLLRNKTKNGKRKRVALPLFVFRFSFLLLLAGCSLFSGSDDAPPPLVLDAPPPSAWDSLTAVANAPSPPARDMAALAAELQGIDAPRTAVPDLADFQEGDVAPFWVKQLDSGENIRIDAELIYRSAALNLWADTAVNMNAQDAAAAAQVIESKILPANRAFFGQEWQPGVDGDDRVNILHVAELGSVAAAYFWSGDEYVTAVNPFSNQRELLYVSLKNGPIGSDAYFRAIAHEFQHLIQWQTDANEDAWLNEGLGELATHIIGLNVDRPQAYANMTDIQLTDLRQEPEVIEAHYAAAYLFSVYFLDRFGQEATQALVQRPENGRAGFEAMLAELDASLSFNDLFADWLAANYLAGAGLGEGVYQYDSLDMPEIEPETIRRFPAEGAGGVNQFGADYLRIRSDEPFTLVFTGTQQTALAAAQPRSGDYFWMSLPADESDMRLTRAFDLSGLDGAALTFWTWYDIEEGWDYGYVAASVDDGRTWTLLETESTTRDNPQGNSLGPGFTGKSGGGETAVWVQETANLTPFAGQEALIRFQYLTDGAVHEQGFLLDDITIMELDYTDDAETDAGAGVDAGWEAAGFVRVGSALPQQFLIQRILIGEDGARVERLSLDENQQNQWQFPMDKATNEAILIISGVTPATRNPAAYAYRIFK